MALVTAADLDVARIDEEWLITNMVAGSTELTLSLVGGSGSEGTEGCRRRGAPSAEPGDDRLVRAVGRLPAKVHTKLLIAFVGTAVLLVAVGAPRAARPRAIRRPRGRLGPLQERAAAYSKLQSDTAHVRLLLAENVDPTSIWSGRGTTDR